MVLKNGSERHGGSEEGKTRRDIRGVTVFKYLKGCIRRIEINCSPSTKGRTRSKCFNLCHGVYGRLGVRKDFRNSKENRLIEQVMSREAGESLSLEVFNKSRLVKEEKKIFLG